MLLWLCVPALAAAQEAALSPEPQVFLSGSACGQVTGMAVDDSGRIWLSVTARSYGRGVYTCTTDQMLRDDLAVFSLPERRACLERWKKEGLLPAFTPDTALGTGSLTENSESVVRVTDENSDGKVEDSRVFAAEFSDPLDGPAAGLVPLPGNAVLFACTPSLWRLEDDNGDGRSDRREPLLTGLGVRSGNGLAGINAITTGPDGYLYFTAGDRGCRVTGSDGRRVLLVDTGGVFRCAQDGTGLELLASGLRSPAGIVVDLRGRIFVADAGPENVSRLLQIVPGADCGWDAAVPERAAVFAEGHRPPGMQQEVARLPGRVTGLIPELQSDASGLRLLISTGDRSGALLPLEVLDKQAGVEVRAGQSRWQGAAACAPAFAPDGTLYWSEWKEGFTASSGCRILRSPADAKPALIAGAEILRTRLKARPPGELAALMEHAHPFVRERARQALVALGYEESLEIFTRIARRSPLLAARFNALWGLAELGRAEPVLLNEIGLLLSSTEPAVRALAVQILGDAAYAGPPQDMLALLRDPDPQVRAAAAVAAGRLRLPGGLPALLAAFPSLDPADSVMRASFTFALMRLAPPEQLAGYAEDTEAPAPVRQCALHALCRMRASQVAAFLDGSDAALAAEAALAVYDLRILPAFPQLAALAGRAAADTALQSPQVLLRVMAAAQYTGTPEAAALVASLAALSLDEPLRLRAFETLAAWDTPPEYDPLHGRRAIPLAREAGIARPLLRGLLTVAPAGLSEASAARISQIAARVNNRPSAGQLAAAVKEVKLPYAARVDALQQLAAIKPAEALALSRALVGGQSGPHVLAAARTSIMRLDNSASYTQIQEALAQGSPQEMQATLLAAQRFDSKQSETFWLETGRALYLAKIPPPARIEVMEGLLQRDKESRSKWRRLLEVIEADFMEELDPLARWRMCETGGDPEKGRRLFETSRFSACMDCHSLHGRGGVTAPELDGIGRRRQAPELLASLILPSRTVVSGHGTVKVTMKSRAEHTGILRRRGGETLFLDSPRGLMRLPEAEVKAVSAPESAMPPVSSILTPREVRDLVAFLSGL